MPACFKAQRLPRTGADDGTGLPLMTRVKICGITRAEDALLAVELGASALGFNFYKPSPRYIEPRDARKITAQTPPFVTAVGVFADEPDTSKIRMMAEQSGLGAVQLHGPRVPADLSALRAFPVIRAVAVSPNFDPSSLVGLTASAFLLDACEPQLIGGTGKTIDWQQAREVRLMGYTIILAGGLTAENAATAIRAVRPYSVDVASGVESSPGIKDAAKLRAFFAAVEEADRALRFAIRHDAGRA